MDSMTLVMAEASSVRYLASTKQSIKATFTVAGDAFARSWSLNPSLTVMVVFSLCSLIFSTCGLCVDHRHINGEMAWIKPCKFGISLALYGATLIWISQYLRGGHRLFNWTTRAALLGAMLELSAITTQVLRGTTSHFNVATPVDAGLWYMVKIAIVPVSMAVIVLCILLVRQKSLPAVFGLSLRLGMVLTIVGFIPGIIMILPESVQQFITEVEVNGHTIGFVTGGPGIPWLGWSSVAGDLRVAHFVGIHALQVIPLVGWAISRYLGRLSSLRQRELVWNLSFTYFGFIALLTWQALRAESIVHPGPHTLEAYFLLLGLSILAGLLTLVFRPLPVQEALDAV